MITGEQFIENNKREYIAAKYSPLSVDMETASIAHVCYNGLPLFRFGRSPIHRTEAEYQNLKRIVKSFSNIGQPC